MTDGGRGDRQPPHRTRRRFVRGLGLATVAGLAGCFGVGGNGETPTATDPAVTETVTPTGTPTATPTSTSTPNATPTDTPERVVSISGSYPSYRGGPGRRAFVPGADTPGSDAAVAAAIDLPAPVFQPVVDGTTVYLARRAGEADSATVDAYDLQRGTRRWGRDLGARAVGAPAAAGDRLVVGTSAGTTALGPDGRVAWTVDDAQAGFPPAVTGDRVFVAGERSLVALTLDGDREWSLPLESTPLAAPAADGSAVYLVFRDGNRRELVAFAADTGRSQWRHTVRIDTGTAPVATGDAVYLTSRLVQGGVSALSASDGDTRWEAEFRALRAPAVTDDYAVGATRSSVRCHALTDGNEVWDVPLSGDRLAGPAASADTTYLAVRGEDGPVLLAFDTATGAVRWSLATDRPVDSLAILDGGLLATVRGEDGPARLLVVAGAEARAGN